MEKLYERVMNKRISFLIILPLFFTLTGCNVSDLTSLGGVNVDDTLSNIEEVGAELDNPSEAIHEVEKIASANDNGIALSNNKVIINIDSEGRMSPFVPYKERNLSYAKVNFGDLPLPPAGGQMDDTLSNLITAKVTGILYDPSSPSALINVMDSDYLVKQGDKVESFQISKITKDYVAIKTGSNIYRAKVGDIVDGELYGTGVYNLGHRFAGRNTPARKEDILIVKTKKSSDSDKKPVTNLNDLELPPIPESLKLPTISVPAAVGDIPAPAGTNVKKDVK